MSVGHWASSTLASFEPQLLPPSHGLVVSRTLSIHRGSRLKRDSLDDLELLLRLAIEVVVSTQLVSITLVIGHLRPTRSHSRETMQPSEPVGRTFE